MNRARANNVVLHTLFYALILLVASIAAMAQSNRALSPRGTTPIIQALSGAGRTRAASQMQHTYAGTSLTRVPSNLTRRRYSRTGISRAPNDGAVIRQTVLITKRDPAQQYSGVPAPSQDQHPFATNDEKYIYFDSDRADDTTIPQVSTGIFNLYRMFLDGSGITKITTGNVNKIEPAVAQDGARIAYVAGGTYTNLATNLDNPTTAGFNLYFIDLNSSNPPVSLTLNNASSIGFLDVRHPTWSPAGDKIAFAGKRSTDPANYHIFIIDVQSTRITQMTSGASNDYAPAWSPNGLLIAFTTNATGFGPGGAPLIASGTATNDDIYVLNPNPVTPNPARVTNFSINGKQASNKNPAWSTLKTDPLHIATPETDTAGNIVSGPNLLAFATNRQDTAHDGNANDVGTTYEIYWMRASIKPDPVVPASYTVSTPESASSTGNHALKLRTSTPDTAIDPTDPASMFDPSFGSNEDYPTWPQYINSYRIFYQSDRGLSPSTIGNNTNIWGSTLFDINAPTLLKYDAQNNEIIHVGREIAGSPSAADTAVRQLNAGETVRFRTRVVDYETGVESVWLQIKNPNSAPQSADGVEHKVFFVGPGALDNTTSLVNAPYEWDAQAINPATNLYRKPERISVSNKGIFGTLPAGWPGWNMYTAGIDDVNAMSGFSSPPDDDDHDFSRLQFGDPEGGFWLRLYDDGPVSQGGHEPEGETAGDGVYTAVWQTPADQPSDWYLDLIVRDNAVDPFNTPTDVRGVNWKIYDNVWGFTTAPFVGKGQFLYVNDYDCGQRFFQTNFGSGTTFSTFFNGWPTESWNTEFDAKLFPIAAFQGTQALDVTNFLTPLGAFSYGLHGSFPDTTVQDGSNVPVTGSYDQWRILARGPIPDSILNGYRAHVENQPADVIAGGTGPNQVTVAERAIIWHSPYPGNLFVGPGTLIDSDTQARLAAFVKSGGRLLVNGGNIPYGLTLSQGGGGINPFLNQTLHATFVAGNITPPTDYQLTMVAGQGTHPISGDSLYSPVFANNTAHLYPGTPTNLEPPAATPLYLSSIPGTTRAFMCPNTSFFADNVVLFTGTVGTPGQSGVDAFYASGTAATKPAIMWYTDTSLAPTTSKVVFSPFGWEQINPEFYVTGKTLVLKNRRTELVHNAGDYLRTGRLVGTVRDFNGSGPLGRVFVRAISQNPNIPAAKQVAATAYTQSDGSFVLNGLDADGIYAVDAFKAGFATLHLFGNYFHGGWQSRVDFFLTKAQPGTISGTITLANGGAPAPGIIVVAQSTSDPTLPTYTATTDVSGKYTIANVPADIYQVSPAPNTPGNLTSLGYGSATPPSYGWVGKVGPPEIIPVGWPTSATPAGIKPAVTVAPAQNVLAVDFTVKSAPGRILGTVTDAATTQPVSGATVTAKNAIGSFTANTGADGTYTLTGVDPGSYMVTAGAPGYATSDPTTVNVTSAQDTINVNFALKTVPPGSISGLVQSSSGVPIGGVTVTVSKLDGTVLQTTTSGQVQTTTGGYQYNFRFVDSIPAGAKVKVDAAKDGFTNKTGVLTVGPIKSGPTPNAGVAPETTGVNFTLDPLYTYQSGLSLVSAPYEYTASAASLFSIPAADVASKQFAFTWWNPTANAYVAYPTPPADTFHLGKGYFMQEVNTSIALALTTKGTPAPQNPDGSYKTFAIPLQAGWNLIGDPFPFSLNFLTLQVMEQDGSIRDVLTSQTGSSPALGAALWTYENGNYQVVFTLDAFRGYWIRAFRPVTLLVTPSSQQGRSVTNATKSLLDGNAQGNGWKLNLVATAGDVRSAPGIIGVHPSASDSYDMFKLEAPPAVGTRAVSLTTDHNDWSSHVGQYSVDVRSNAGSQQKWDMVLNSNVGSQPVTITWPTLATVPGKYDIVLTDQDTKQTINLRNQSSYTVAAGKAAGPLTRHLTVEVRRATRSQLYLADVTTRLNQGTRGPVSAEIQYTLSSSASVQVNILLRGRTLRTVEQNVTRAAGVGQAVWDLRQSDGTFAPADSYTAEVTATDTTGRKVRRLVPLLLSR